MKACGTLIVILCALIISTQSAEIADPAYARQIAEADQYLGDLQRERVIGGIAAVQKEGRIVYAKGFGYAVEEFDVLLDPAHTIQIGSNSKLFTAVAVYQLQEKGLLDVNDPVNSYIDPDDFGLNGTWCPLIYGREEEGCQEPTFKQLMEMSSGALPISNQACGDGNPPWSPDDWYWEYRLLNVDGKYGYFSGDSNVLDGTYNTKDALKFANWMNLPFEAAPGEKYCYVNNNFVLAGYVVEKLSNMSLVDYITQNIIVPANLTSTYVWTGARGGMPTGIRKGDIIAPGYLTTFVNTTAGPPTFSVVNRMQDFMPATIAIATQATGDMVSSVGDIIRWYSLLTSSPETVGLTRETVEYMTTPWKKIPVPNADGSEFYFGQGIGIVLEPDTGNSSSLTYTGDIWDTSTSIRFWENAEDATKGDAVAFFSNYAVAIPPQDDGSCVIGTSTNGTMTLDAQLCSGEANANKIILNKLAEIFDVSSTIAGDNSVAPAPDFILPTLPKSPPTSG